MREPQMSARSLLKKIKSADKAFAVANAPYRMSRSIIETGTTLPELGGDTREVLKNVLGLADDEIKDLVARAIVEN